MSEHRAALLLEYVIAFTLDDQPAIKTLEKVFNRTSEGMPSSVEFTQARRLLTEAATIVRVEAQEEATEADLWNDLLADIDALDTLEQPAAAPVWKWGDKVEWYHASASAWLPATVYLWHEGKGAYKIKITYPSGHNRGTYVEPTELRPIQ